MEESHQNLFTDICEKKFAFKWSIHNIARIPITTQSRRFSLVDGESKDWYATVTLLSCDQFQVSLTYDDIMDVSVRIEHFSRATDSKGRPLGGISSSVLQFLTFGDQKVLLDKIRLPKTETSLVQEKAIFECTMNIYGCGLVTTCDVVSCNPNMDVVKYRNDFRHMMSDEEFADVKIHTADGEIFNVHGHILRFRAPKFFDNHLSEIMENNVKLTTVHSNIFHSLLAYIYTGEVDELAKAHDYHDLYCLACTYQLKGLQRHCAKIMARELSVDTLCDIFLQAERCEDEELIMQSKIFMRGHLKELSLTLKWSEMLAARPFLLEKVKKIRH